MTPSLEILNRIERDRYTLAMAGLWAPHAVAVVPPLPAGTWRDADDLECLWTAARRVEAVAPADPDFDLQQDIRATAVALAEILLRQGGHWLDDDEAWGGPVWSAAGLRLCVDLDGGGLGLLFPVSGPPALPAPAETRLAQAGRRLAELVPLARNIERLERDARRLRTLGRNYLRGHRTAADLVCQSQPMIVKEAAIAAA